MLHPRSHHLRIGIAACWLLASLMFGIQPAAPWVYSVTIALLIATALLSSVGPTLRAMRTDPVETLRSQ